MRTVYYYDFEGEFSSTEINDFVASITITTQSEIENIKAITESGYTIHKSVTLPITKYITRYGHTIWLASRNEFEAKCLIKNHLDLDIHAEISIPLERFELYPNDVDNRLMDILLLKLKNKVVYKRTKHLDFGMLQFRASL